MQASVKKYRSRSDLDELIEVVRQNTSTQRTDQQALVQTLKAEGNASRKEEQCEDRAKSRREWITIVLLVLNLGAIFWQVREMIKVYDPIREQADAQRRAADAATRQSANAERALVQAQRAWVGPQNASFASDPEIGKAIEITVQYQNSGHEPATQFDANVDSFVLAGTAEGDAAAAERTQEYMTRCRAADNGSTGSVVYPNSGFGSGYNLTVWSGENVVDRDLVEGKKVIFVQGCFRYRTFESPKHSYFCYLYRKGATKTQNLNICPRGHEAN
jgi:hypothetical protein